MRLTVLGCSGSVPGPNSPASGYLVDVDGSRLVLDLGNGSFGALQRHADPATITGICLSHLHPDHCNDLCGYYVARRYGPGAPPVSRIPVWGPDGTGERMAAAYGLAPGEAMDGVFDFRPYPPSEFKVGRLVVRAVRVNHPITAYAIRVEHDGRTLVYSGDTGQSASLTNLARGADLLLCEAGYGTLDGEPPDVHLTGREAGEHAFAAGVKKMIVTHVPPWCDLGGTVEAARAAFDGPVDAAVADRSWEI